MPIISMMMDPHEEILTLKEKIKWLERSERQARQTVKELQAREGRFRRLVEKSPGVVYQFMMDRNGKFSFPYINESVLTLTGVSQSEIMRDISVMIDKIHPEDREVFEKGVLESAQLLTSYRFAFRYLKDNSYIWIEARSIPERMPDGTTVWDGFLMDISARKKAEEALQESVQVFRDLAEKSMAGVYVLQDGWFRYCNAHLARIFGYESEEVTDHLMVRDVILPEDWPLVESNIRRRISGELKSLNYGFRIRTRDNETRFVEVYSSQTIFQGRPAVIGTLLDITERKLAEQKVIDSERLLSAIVAASPIGIGKVRDRNLVWVNDTICRILGYSQSELEGKSTAVFFDSPEEYERAGKVLYEGGRVETRLILTDGSARHVWIQVAPAEDGAHIFTIADITRQKAVEESHRFTQFAMDRARDIVLWVHNDGTVFYANESACEALGYTQDEILAMSIFDIGPGYTPKIWDKALVRVRQTGSLLVEANLKRKDGTVFPVEISANLVQYEGVEHLCAFVRDTTERRSMENTLRYSEERFRALFESAGDAIVITTDVIVDCNEKTLEMFGCTRQEILGKVLYRFSPDVQPDGSNSIDKARQKGQACLNGVPQIFEWKHCRADGTPFDAEVSLTRIDFHDETYLQAIIRDVTRRKQAEEGLRRLSIAIEQSAEEVIITDPEGVIQYVNPAFEKITGYSRQEAVGQTPRIVKSGVHDNEFYEKFWKTIKSGHIWTGQFTNKRKDGNLIQEDATISPFVNSLGQFAGYVSLKRDITEEMKLHLQLRQAQKMEAIGTLAGGIAHDFNNILTVITGFGTMLKMGMDRNNPLLNHVNQILTSSEKAANLTRALLAYSRKQPIKLAPVGINSIVRGTQKLLQRLLTEDLELSVTLSSDDIYIMADSTQIDQILFNLATNARDAMKSGGRLAITTSMADISEGFIETHGYGTMGRYARLTFSDTGCGMDQQTKEKIFDPFFTTKQLGKGTGLGLSTVYGIVKQHNGYIDVASEQGHGTVFDLYFPVIENVEKEDRASVPLTKGGSETVLLAEDDDSVRFLVKEIIASHGYKVIEATDGQDAIDKFSQSERVDLVILDSVMPKKNGREADIEIRGIRPETKVLFMSGYTKDIMLDRGVEEGKVDFIAKPIMPDELLNRMRDILDRQ